MPIHPTQKLLLVLRSQISPSPRTILVKFDDFISCLVRTVEDLATSGIMEITIIGSSINAGFCTLDGVFGIGHCDDMPLVQREI